VQSFFSEKENFTLFTCCYCCTQFYLSMFPLSCKGKNGVSFYRREVSDRLLINISLVFLSVFLTVNMLCTHYIPYHCLEILYCTYFIVYYRQHFTHVTALCVTCFSFMYMAAVCNDRNIVMCICT